MLRLVGVIIPERALISLPKGSRNFTHMLYVAAELRAEADSFQR
jgi:hypothetical protein